MKIKYRISSVVVSFALLLGVLSGCGSNQNEKKQTTSLQEYSETMLTTSENDATSKTTEEQSNNKGSVLPQEYTDAAKKAYTDSFLTVKNESVKGSSPYFELYTNDINLGNVMASVPITGKDEGIVTGVSVEYSPIPAEMGADDSVQISLGLNIPSIAIATYIKLITGKNITPKDVFDIFNEKVVAGDYITTSLGVGGAYFVAEIEGVSCRYWFSNNFVTVGACGDDVERYDAIAH